MQTLQENWAGRDLGNKYHPDCCGATSKEDMTASLEAAVEEAGSQG